MGVIATALRGYYLVGTEGQGLPERGFLNISGPWVTLQDNEAADRTDMVIGGAAMTLATSSADGLMPAADKAKLDGIRRTGTTTTAAGVPQTPATVLSMPCQGDGIYELELVLKGFAPGAAAFIGHYLVKFGIIAGALDTFTIDTIGSLADTGKIAARGTVTGAAAAAGGEIQITTSAPHGLYDGAEIIVEAVGGTTEANGTWPVTVADSTHMVLTGSTYVHPFTGPGLWGRGGGILGMQWSSNVLDVVVQGVGDLDIVWTAIATLS